MLKADEEVVELGRELSTWNPADVKSVLPLARWSLETVTHLTEYEDEKANRILTAIAFLSALVGVVFAAIVQRYPFSAISKLGGSGEQFAPRLLLTVYCLFGVYFVLLALGTALTLWAVRPRFRIPAIWKSPKPTPASMLFFEEILKVSGRNWASAFTTTSPEKLELEYTKNSILETYLIAQKIPKKLQPLTKAGWLFFASTLVLIILLPLCAATVVCLETASTTISAPVEGKPGTSVNRQPKAASTQEPAGEHAVLPEQKQK